MTAEEIRDRARELGISNIAIYGGEVLFCERFRTAEGGGSASVARDWLHYLQNLLEPLGLQVGQHHSDLDSIWGTIAKAKANADPPAQQNADPQAQPDDDPYRDWTMDDYWRNSG
jgi:hypothetical protein